MIGGGSDVSLRVSAYSCNVFVKITVDAKPTGYK